VAMSSTRLMPLFGIAMWVLMTSGCMNESKMEVDQPPIAVTVQPMSKPNAEMQEVLYQLARLGWQPLPTLTAREARAQPTATDAVKALLKSRNESIKPEAVKRVENLTIPGADESVQIPIRVYWPQGEGPFPIVVYYHGGGFVIADLDTYDASARALVNAAHAIVVSVHYRQGPEHRFPAAHDDAYAAYRWTLAHAESLNGDPKRIAVAGESAGGNLAAAVAIRARNSRLQQMPVYQVLIYPVTNYAFDSPSQQQNRDTRPLNTQMLRWFYDKYLTEPADGREPVFSILQADMEGLPPATVITADIDPLRSEGQAYAQSLAAAGVPVDYKNYKGVTHEFFGMGAVLLEARQAVDQAATGLRAAFNNQQEYQLAKEDL
jgi:acetyl esterase